MIFRNIGLSAVCLAVVAESIMIPSTVSLPGLTEESLNRADDTDEVKALPIPQDFRKQLKELNAAAPGAGPLWMDKSESFDDLDWNLVPIDQLPDDISLFEDDDEDVKWFKVEFTFDDDDNDDDNDEVDEDDDDDTQDDEDPCSSDSSLKAFICRFRNTVEDKFEEVKPYFKNPHRRPCPKKLAAMAKHKAEEVVNHPPVSGGMAKFWPYFHPGEEMPHKRPVHHHKHHSKFAKVLHKICKGLRVFVTGFLIPVLIGVAAGMTASLLGMCVGTFLAWLWIKFVRGGRRGNASGRVMLDESDNMEAATAEKDGLLKSDTETETEEAPPTYAERE